jgi:hypothetical protein
MQTTCLNTEPSFFNQRQETVHFSHGETKLPCFFRNVQYRVCLFQSNQLATEERLAGKGLIPALRWGKGSVVALGLIKYNDSDLGAYNEVVLAIPVLPVGVKKPFSNWLNLLGPLATRKVGQHIIHIPVTSEFSRAAGEELWGYPKIKAPVQHLFTRQSLHSTVADPATDEIILKCTGELGISIPSVPLSLVTYSFLHHQLYRTPVAVRGAMRLYLQHSIRLEVGSATHPMANDLRLLGLDGKKPFLVMGTEKFQSVFYKGGFFTAVKGR